jgi:hypothetical protein
MVAEKNFTCAPMTKNAKFYIASYRVFVKAVGAPPLASPFSLAEFSPIWAPTPHTTTHTCTSTQGEVAVVSQVRSVHVRFGGDDDDDDDDDEDSICFCCCSSAAGDHCDDLPRRSSPTFSQYIYTLGTKDVKNYNVQEFSLDFVAFLCRFGAF